MTVNEEQTTSEVTRRSVIKTVGTAAWAAPVIVVATAAPSMAVASAAPRFTIAGTPARTGSDLSIPYTITNGGNATGTPTIVVNVPNASSAGNVTGFNRTGTAPSWTYVSVSTVAAGGTLGFMPTFSLNTPPGPGTTTATVTPGIAPLNGDTDPYT